MSSLETTTNLKAKYVLHLNILSTFFLISVSDAGKQLSVPYSFATFGPRQMFRNIWAQAFATFGPRHHYLSSKGTISPVRCICKKAHGTEQAIRSGPTRSENSQGFVLSLGSPCQVLETQQQTGKGLAKEVLHASFFMPGVTQISQKLWQAGSTVCTR